jgi:uncharacterized protein YcfL
MKKITLLIATLFLICGCSKSTKRTLGLTETMPDEYKVKRNKSLEVPPIYKQKATKPTSKNSKFSKAEQDLLKAAK